MTVRRRDTEAVRKTSLSTGKHEHTIGGQKADDFVVVRERKVALARVWCGHSVRSSAVRGATQFGRVTPVDDVASSRRS